VTKSLYRRNRNDSESLTYGPISIEVFKEAWSSDLVTDWIWAISNKVYFPSSLLLTDELLEPKILPTKRSRQGAIFESHLRKNPYLPKKYVEMYLDSWESLIFNDRNATAVCLEAIIEKYIDEPLYIYFAFRRNTPLASAAAYLANNWETVKGTVPIAKPLNDIESRCDSYLKSLGWTPETLEAIPLLIKLEMTK